MYRMFRQFSFVSSFQGYPSRTRFSSRFIADMHCSLIAQLVEHSTVNRVVTGSSPVRGAIMERCPSWPKEHDWKACRRHKRLEGSNPSLSAISILDIGPLVKWLRHLPFTEVTGVRVPYGSPY